MVLAPAAQPVVPFPFGENDASREQVAGHAEDIDEELRQQRLRFEMLPRSRYPNVVGLAPHLARFSGDEAFRRVVRQILGNVG